jgi:hypothetical protein
MPLNFGDLDHFSSDEELIAQRPFDEWARHVVASAHVVAEEESAAVSIRPTVPVFHGEPWR